MKALIKTVNQNGLSQIAEFLKNNHMDGERIHSDIGCLHSWASDAESQLSQGNTPSIEIHHSRAISGVTQEFTISDKGIDSQEIDIED